MAKSIHKGKRTYKAAERSASVMNPKYIALIENFRLMDGDIDRMIREQDGKAFGDGTHVIGAGRAGRLGT